MGEGENVGEGWETKQRACEVTEIDKAKRNKGGARSPKME